MSNMEGPNSDSDFGKDTMAQSVSKTKGGESKDKEQRSRYGNMHGNRTSHNQQRIQAIRILG